MRVFHSIAAVGLVLTSAAVADIAVKIPAISVLNSPYTDSTPTSVKGVSGIGTYVSGATSTSTASLSLFASGADAGAVRLTYDIANGAKAYSAATGILVPLTKAWDVLDISSADSIYFDIRTDNVGTMVNFLIGSPFETEFGDPACALQTNVDGAGTPMDGLTLTSTAWKTIGISTKIDLIPSPWYTGGDGETDLVAVNSVWNDAIAPGLNIGTKVKNLQFQPVWTWKSSGATIGNPKGSIYVKNIRIKRASLYTWTDGVGCAGPSFQLDNFSASKNAKMNAVGGYWFAFTDTSATKVNDSATGSSTIQPLSGKTWDIAKIAGGAGALRATLNKTVPASTFPYHPYAGWADMGTNFATDLEGANIPVSFPNLSALSFDFYVGKNIADTLSWDETNLPYIIVKAGQAGVEDAYAYSVKVPVSKGDGSNICIDMSKFAQPSWYDAQNGFSTPFSAESITQFMWEMKIDDQSDASINLSGPNTFLIQNVKMWGLDSATAVAAVAAAVDGSVISVRDRATRAGNLKADYRNGLQISYALAGTSAKVEILRLDGSKVKSFEAPATATNLQLPVSLSRGTYLVAVRAAGKTVVAPLSVAR